jgi:molybdopterin-guanine dinucleotide biosynthesis protein A
MLPAAFHPPVKTIITGCILAGGRGLRMGGVDKGLQLFRGQTLVQHAIARLQPQVSQVLINANRHQADYNLTGLKVIADTDFADKGPLSGFHSGLQHCDTEWLVTVPCDSPFFPLDLVNKLSQVVREKQSLIAMVQTPRLPDNTLEMQPVFCLMHRSLADSLKNYLASGQRKISDWALQQGSVAMCQMSAADAQAQAFMNVNTLQELQDLSP